MGFMADYEKHVKEREALGVPPLPLTAEQTAQVIELLKEIPIVEEEKLLNLLENRVPPGVDDAAYVKAAFLHDIVQGKTKSAAISPLRAVKMLGMMLGGFNVKPLIEALKHEDKEIAQEAANQLKKTLLVYDAFNDVKELSDSGNDFAKEVMQSWANAEWFLSRPELPEEITVTVFKVPG